MSLASDGGASLWAGLLGGVWKQIQGSYHRGEPGLEALRFEAGLQERHEAPAAARQAGGAWEAVGEVTKQLSVFR